MLIHETHVNGWEPAVYVSCMSQNFRLFHISNLFVRNFRISLLMYPVSVTHYAEVSLRRSLTIIFPALCGQDSCVALLYGYKSGLSASSRYLQPCSVWQSLPVWSWALPRPRRRLWMSSRTQPISHLMMSILSQPLSHLSMSILSQPLSHLSMSILSQPLSHLSMSILSHTRTNPSQSRSMKEASEGPSGCSQEDTFSRVATSRDTTQIILTADFHWGETETSASL